jgi:ATP-dependent helicase HrpA
VASAANVSSEGTARSPAGAKGLVPGQRFIDWSFGELPELLEIPPVRGQKASLIGYPALVDAGDAAELRMFDEPAEARSAHREGLGRLFAIALKEPLKFFERSLPDLQRLSLQYAAFGSLEELRRDLVEAVIDRTCLIDPLPRDQETFCTRVTQARPRLNLVGQELARTLAGILAEYTTVLRKMQSLPPQAPIREDLAVQLSALLPGRFVRATHQERFRHLVRYLKAASARIEKWRTDPSRDAARMAEMAPLLQSLRRLHAQRRGEDDPRLEELRWLIEELRVSLFAQELRTPVPVSVKRLLRMVEALRA